jgi:hypothetical protein
LGLAATSNPQPLQYEATSPSANRFTLRPVGPPVNHWGHLSIAV